MEFDWTEYLESNKCIGVPEELFNHVEASLNNGIRQGMLLEVVHKANPDVYWIAQITMVCGHLLRIKFIGAENEEWFDISNTKMHPLGWCGKYDEYIEPPDKIYEKYGDSIIDIMKKALLAEKSVSIEALENKGLSPIDRIKVGMKVEVQNVVDPYRYWIATVWSDKKHLAKRAASDARKSASATGGGPSTAAPLTPTELRIVGIMGDGFGGRQTGARVPAFYEVIENVGGRLLLRYDGCDEDLKDFWIFFSNPRLSSFGYVTNKGSPWQFKYPGKVNKFSCKNKLSAQLRQSAEESIKEPTPADLFQPSQNLEAHSFVTGMKLEALNPQDMKSIRPATVTKVFNNFHFLITIDDHSEDYEDTKMAWLCDSMHPYIYPIGWAQKNNITFKTPKIWKEGNFDWDEYLTMTSSVPAPDYCFGDKKPMKDIKVNMKLEAVNPMNHEEIHVASIDSIVEHMVCVLLVPIGEKFWYAQNSDLLLPVGWCDSNNYELHIPDTSAKEIKIEEPKPKISINEDMKSSEEWCERIYFNYKCYAGPSISRNKLSQLPKHVGPGPLCLVLKEVLNKIISASYKPAKLLKDWETEEGTEPPKEGMRLEMLRAKLKSHTYHAYVWVPCKWSGVETFMTQICGRLQACPALCGPKLAAPCPHRCALANKADFHNGTERRGRPKGSVNGRKKKKKGPQEKREKEQPQENESNKDVESVSSEHSAGSTPPSESGTRPNSPDSSEYKRQTRKREHKSNLPKTEIKTRGAKLPNFAVQMKQSHWNKKDVETIYNNTCAKKQRSPDSDEETNESSSNSRDNKNISDVSDSEEPELKKLKFNTYDPLPTDNKMFEKNIMSWMKGKLKLSPNPLNWSVDDVHAYLKNTEECKLIADKMKQEEIDGEALIMLDLATINKYLHLKKEFAMHLCKHIAMIRYHYVVNYEENGQAL